MIHAKPIGYWLKLLDGLIEAAFERELAEAGVARRHWQAMNVLARRSLDVPGLAAAIRPFWTEGAVTVEAVVDDLRSRGWVEGSSGGLLLTEAGESAHAAISERVDGVRAQLMRGLTPDDYEATVGTLIRMATNLGAPGVETARE